MNEASHIHFKIINSYDKIIRSEYIISNSICKEGMEIYKKSVFREIGNINRIRKIFFGDEKRLDFFKNREVDSPFFFVREYDLSEFTKRNFRYMCFSSEENAIDKINEIPRNIPVLLSVYYHEELLVPCKIERAEKERINFVSRINRDKFFFINLSRYKQTREYENGEYELLIEEPLDQTALFHQNTQG